MSVLTCDPLGDRDGLFLGLVREHRAAHDVADGPDAVEVGLAVAVDGYEPAFVQREAHSLRAEPRRVRNAANRNDELVDAQALLLARGIGVIDDDILCRCDLGDVDPELDRQALFGEELPRFLGDLFVGGAQENGQRLQDRDLGAQPPPDAAHLEPDDSGADNAELFRDLGNRQCSIVVEDELVVERCSGKRPRLRAGRDDHVPGHERLSAGTFDLDLPGARCAAGEAAGAGMEGHLVLPEQIQDAVVVLAHDLVLAREHPRDVDRQTLDVDPVVGKGVPRVLEILRRLQERLGRNTANVSAGTAERRLAVGHRPVVDAGSSEAELRGANGGGVAAGTGADDDDVELFSHSISRRSRS